MIPAAEFRERWNSMESTRLQLDHIVRGGRDAIMEYFKLRGSNMTWNNFELSPASKGDEIVYNGDYYYPGTGGRPDSETWIVPLSIVLAGHQACLDFFAEEHRKEVAKAEEMGRAREQREIDTRRAAFLKLKAEFEPAPPPENAIVKSTGSV